MINKILSIMLCLTLTIQRADGLTKKQVAGEILNLASALGCTKLVIQALNKLCLETKSTILIRNLIKDNRELLRKKDYQGLAKKIIERYKDDSTDFKNTFLPFFFKATISSFLLFTLITIGMWEVRSFAQERGKMPLDEHIRARLYNDSYRIGLQIWLLVFIVVTVSAIKLAIVDENSLREFLEQNAYLLEEFMKGDESLSSEEKSRKTEKIRLILMQSLK